VNTGKEKVIKEGFQSYSVNTRSENEEEKKNDKTINNILHGSGSMKRKVVLLALMNVCYLTLTNVEFCCIQRVDTHQK